MALRRRLEGGKITVVQATPSTFRLLLDAGWTQSPGLKVLIGGEATPRELADQLSRLRLVTTGGDPQTPGPAGSVWNMYGPTETTIWSCIDPLEKGAPAPIGRPIATRGFTSWTVVWSRCRLGLRGSFTLRALGWRAAIWTGPG